MRQRKNCLWAGILGLEFSPSIHVQITEELCQDSRPFMYVISTPFLSQIRARSSATNFSARALELALFLLPEYHHTVDLSYARASSFIFKQSPQSSGPHDSPSAHVHERCLDVPCRLNSSSSCKYGRTRYESTSSKCAHCRWGKIWRR